MNHSQLAKVLLQKPLEKQNGNCWLQHAILRKVCHFLKFYDAISTATRTQKLMSSCMPFVLGSVTPAFWLKELVNQRADVCRDRLSNMMLRVISCLLQIPWSTIIAFPTNISAKLKDHVFIFDEPEGKYS